MARDFFKNLPDTTTPLTAPRLNGLLDGDEAMGNIVVDSVKTKNIFNSDNPSAIHSGMTWTGSGKTHYLTSTISFSGGIRWYFEAKAGDKYTFSYKQRNSNSVYLYIREKQTPEWSGTTLKSIVNDATGTSYSFTIENDCYLEITFQTGAAVSNVLFEELQLEKELTKTDYAPYQKIGLDYAEGTWTPTLDTLDGTPTVTYTTRRGSYFRIGNMVYINCYIRGKITALNGTTNYAIITGLPYWPKTGAVGEFPIQNGTCYGTISSWASGVTYNVYRESVGGVAKPTIHIMDISGAGTQKYIVTTTSTMEIGFGGWYPIDTSL